jgi:4-carboxymuconolactone decarboxylase
MSSDPDRERLIEEFGRRSIEKFASVNPNGYVKHMDVTAGLDADFAQVWIDFIYGYLYSRNVIDEKMREIALIAELIALGDTEPPQNMMNHIRSAIRAGAKPEEVLEVMLQSCIRCGMPKAYAAIFIFAKVVEEDGLELPASNKKRHQHLWPPGQEG